jgi:hypothetical protein
VPAPSGRVCASRSVTSASRYAVVQHGRSFLRIRSNSSQALDLPQAFDPPQAFNPRKLFYLPKAFNPPEAFNPPGPFASPQPFIPAPPSRVFVHSAGAVAAVRSYHSATH